MRSFLFRTSFWKPLKNSAITSAVVIFVNSAGCNPNPPILYHDVAPEIVCPKMNNPPKLKIDNP